MLFFLIDMMTFRYKEGGTVSGNGNPALIVIIVTVPVFLLFAILLFRWTTYLFRRMERRKYYLLFMIVVLLAASMYGEMTVLMRQAGLVIPGVCGPAREQWSQLGQEAPEL
ncbi:hypothetical protein KQI79_16315 [Paenibacillus sp. MSJ-34]|nr:hypothetical protein [Paenibacillus sp. MSJ-34]